MSNVAQRPCKHCGTTADYDRPRTGTGALRSYCQVCRRKGINGHRRHVAKVEAAACPAPRVVPKIELAAVKRALRRANTLGISLVEALRETGVLSA